MQPGPSRSPTLADRVRSSAKDLFDQCLSYLGIGGRVRREPVTASAALQAYLASRASFIAQTSLYGYLRTRAGQRYPELFDDDGFVMSINVAKWHMWLACLSDLTVFAGGLLARGGVPLEQVGRLMTSLLDTILDDNGLPGDAGPDYAEHASQVRARIALTAWADVDDGEGCFRESPSALVKYAPVVEALKRMDEDIVQRSVRYHWLEVRSELRQVLDPAAVGRAAVAEGI